MTFPYIDIDDPSSLGFDSKWKIIRDVIDYALTEGMTQTATRAELRTLGFRFGNDAFASEWHNLSDYRTSFEYPTGLDWEVTPDINTMQPSTRIPENTFQYKGYVSYWNASAEVFEDRYFTVKSTDLLNKIGVLDKLWAYAETIYPVTAETVNEFYYLGAYRGVG